MSKQEFSGKRMLSKIDSDGQFSLHLIDEVHPQPKKGYVVVRIEATPINPSDVNLMLGPVEKSSLSNEKNSNNLQGRVPKAALDKLKARLGKAADVGLEGAGTVVATGPGDEALLGRTVAMFKYGNYAQYRTFATKDLLVLPEGTTPEDAAACFTNPMTVLAMLETMRRRNHTALIHTVASSNLGKMLIRLCQEDNIKLVNIVRKAEQVDILKAMGAEWVCNSSDPAFTEQLTHAIAETGATCVFDPISGGPMAGNVLRAMEAAAQLNAKRYSSYGSTTFKEAFIYGALDRSPMIIDRDFGASWAMNGWLLFNCLAEWDEELINAMKQRVANNIKTIFASSYGGQLNLEEAIKLDNVRAYTQKTTGNKYLIRPHG